MPSTDSVGGSSNPSYDSFDFSSLNKNPRNVFYEKLYQNYPGYNTVSSSYTDSVINSAGNISPGLRDFLLEKSNSQSIGYDESYNIIYNQQTNSIRVIINSEQAYRDIPPDLRKNREDFIYLGPAMTLQNAMDLYLETELGQGNYTIENDFNGKPKAFMSTSNYNHVGVAYPYFKDYLAIDTRYDTV